MTSSWFPACLPPDIWLRNATVPAALLDTMPQPSNPENLTRIDLRITDGHISAIAPAERRRKA